MSSNDPMIHRFQAMTVPCEIQIFSAEQPRNKWSHIAREIEQNTLRLEAKYNFYSARSWLTQHVNQRTCSNVELDEESLSIFHQLSHLNTLSNGVFDTTIGSVKALLKLEPTLTREVAFQRLQPVMGKDSWHIEDSKLMVKNSETQFDFGGVIKEYAVDQAVNIAKGYGVQSMLVNFGGDIYALGTKPDGSPFNIAVLNPKNSSEPYFAVPITDSALTTSAHYERRFQFGDTDTSHILSETGTEEKILSVTVVAHSALIAGALSTSLTLHPTLTLPQEVAAIFIDDHLAIQQDTEFLQK